MDEQISLEQIKRFKEIYNSNPQNKIIENAITKNGLENACINRDIIIENQPVFNIELPESKRYDQKNSVKCWIVAGLNVNNITTTSATLAWTGGASQWQVAYSTYGDFADATQTIVSSASYTITGLTPATHYYARVRAYCGGSEYGSWSNVLEFNTDCNAITVYPWSENFDDDAIGTLPVCWSRINTSTSSNYSSYPKVFNRGSNCLCFSSVYSSSTNYDPQPQYAVLPVMENLSGKVIMFNAQGGNTSSTFKN